MEKSKRLKVAFVSPPPPPGAHVDYQNPTIGLASMAAILGKNGFEVAVIDCPRLEISHDDLKQEIALFRPDLVGVTCVGATLSSAFRAARVTKESCPKAVVVLGGPHTYCMEKQILNEESQIDIVVRGEAERTILELASKVSDGGLKELHEIAGISFRKNGQIVQTIDRPFINDLDQLPFPAYNHFPLRKYRLFGKLTLPIVTSRGCPFQCAFCIVPKIAGREFRARSPVNVVDELEWLRDVHGAGAYSFYDEVFTYDKGRVFEICEEMKRRDVCLPWDCQTRVDQISRKLLAEMRDANCQLISFGVESGSQKMLDRMKKGTTVEQNERAIRWAKDAGLSVGISMVVGYPGETMETFKETLDFIRRNEPDDAYLSLVTPYPGTDLYDLVKDLGWNMSKGWTHYETRTPVLENPSLPSKEIKRVREAFYNHFYSVPYMLRQSRKGRFGQVRARTAMHHFFWQTKIPFWLADNIKKLTRF